MTFIQTIVDAQRAAARAEGSEVEQSVVKDHHQGSIDSSISGNWDPLFCGEIKQVVLQSVESLHVRTRQEVLCRRQQGNQQYLTY